jgi:hypothetical protein
VHVIAARNQALTRQVAALPRTYTATGADWAIYAVPAQSLGMLGFFIALGNENPPATDVDLQAGFYNPFPGTEHIAAVGAGGNFNMLAPGATTPLTLNNGSRQWVAVDVSGPCFSNVAQLQLTMSIPQIVYAGGLALAADNQVLGLADTPDVALTWTNTSGPVDAAIVTIFEVQKQGAATAIAQRYMAYTSTRGAAIVPRDQLQAGKTYIVEISHLLGVDAVAGDLETQHYPLGQSVAWSHTFQP